VADELGRREGRRVTPQRIRQIHDRAVEKLKASEMAGLVAALTEVA
jgi:DNA-directed RNA polymerase sigma subunit (sigma70/sigma32)